MMLKVPTYLANPSEWLREIALAVNLLIYGRSNAIGQFTLTAGQSSTEIIDLNVGTDSRILLTPITANAAAALSTTYFSIITKGTFTINHANNGQTDRTFKYGIIG